MRKLILILALIVSSPAAADALTAGELLSMCNGNEEAQRVGCGYYILGAAQGIALGDGSVRDDKGVFVTRKKTHFCISDDMPLPGMVAAFKATVGALALAYPNDLKMPAISAVGVAMATAWPCPKSN